MLYKQNNINHKTKTTNLISILGAGESGVGAAVLAKKQGVEVFVSDFGEIKQNYKNELIKLGVNFESGSHNEEKILSSTEIIKSPGISDKSPIIKKAIEKGIPIISEIEFASRYTNAKIVAITGSNGKTTTTMLTYHILQKAGLNVGLAGNIGESFAKQVAEKSFEYYVLELSSFQLDGIINFKPDISVLLNITPDHLDRYEYNFENYIQSKLRIAKNQTLNDTFIYWVDDVHIQKNIHKIRSTKKHFNLDFKKFNSNLKGKHNHLNIAAAVLVAESLGVKNEFIESAIASFQPVKHRLQKIAVVNGIEFINDSKATNVDAVYYALEGINQSICWIVGGVDKGNDYSVLFPFLNKIKAVIALGKDNQKLLDVFGGKIPHVVSTSSMNDAVEKAFEFAQKNDVVLLSPACASFDLFNNYEHRGDEFIQCVHILSDKYSEKMKGETNL